MKTLLPLLTALGFAFVAAAAPWHTLARQPAEWYRSAERIRVTTNVLSWQSAHGLWPTNLDTTARPNGEGAQEIKGTFENGATVEELRFLAGPFAQRRTPSAGRLC